MVGVLKHSKKLFCYNIRFCILDILFLTYVIPIGHTMTYSVQILFRTHIMFTVYCTIFTVLICLVVLIYDC